MFRITEDLTSSLIRQPESGMGYQVVDAVMTDSRIKRGIAYNAELLILDEDRQFDQRAIITRGLKEVARAANSTADRIRSLSVVADARAATLKRSGAAAGGADVATEETTKAGDRFYRFSAFVNDRRVMSDGSLSAGSYATTEADGIKVKTGTEAVERYALPNDDPASHRFSIAPRSGTLPKKGIVQPANGHQGGGIEVIFTLGTQPGTVTTPPTKIPDK